MSSRIKAVVNRFEADSLLDDEMNDGAVVPDVLTVELGESSDEEMNEPLRPKAIIGNNSKSRETKPVASVGPMKAPLKKTPAPIQPDGMPVPQSFNCVVLLERIDLNQF